MRSGFIISFIRPAWMSFLFDIIIIYKYERTAVYGKTYKI